MIKYTVNEKEHCFDAPITVASLLTSLGLANKRLAVEVAGSIIPKSEHADVMLADGSRIEIIEAIGGG